MSFFYCTCCHFCIVLLVPLVVWLVKYLGWAFVAAAAFQHLFLVLCYINFLPLQVTYFRALPHSLGYIFQYIFLSLMILNIMHHVHDCNRVLEVRRGLVVSIVLFPPTSLKDRVIKALELCSCGKEKKKKKKRITESILGWFVLILNHFFHDKSKYGNENGNFWISKFFCSLQSTPVRTTIGTGTNKARAFLFSQWLEFCQGHDKGRSQLGENITHFRASYN